MKKAKIIFLFKKIKVAVINKCMEFKAIGLDYLGIKYKLKEVTLGKVHHVESMKRSMRRQRKQDEPKTMLEETRSIRQIYIRTYFKGRIFYIAKYSSQVKYNEDQELIIILCFSLTLID